MKLYIKQTQLLMVGVMDIKQVIPKGAMCHCTWVVDWKKYLLCGIVHIIDIADLCKFKEITPGCSLEGLMLKLKLQYFGHLMRRADSLEKTLMLGWIRGRRRRGRQRMRWLDDITDLMDMGLCESGSWRWTGRPGVLRFRGRKESDTTEQLNWLRSFSKSIPCVL